MFYKIIEKKRDEWLSSPSCVITDLISYIEHQHKMLDAQIESIKTYLLLKIECQNRPLWELFVAGKFNSTNVDDLEVNKATREILTSNPAALALWEYAFISDENGNVNSPKFLAAIKKASDSIDYVSVIKDLFSNVSYPDYLFSIPMGAGKTYLMAALIYLNLYFALAEPDNPIFAHNFILFVPSGLKSSIVPSLRDIQNFNPLWLLPDPVASQLKKLIQYEWLQESSSTSKSNIVKNPNARKISMQVAKPNRMGLVAVTNAEKVILDRVDKDVNIDASILKSLPEEERKEYEATLQANELREQIGLIPGLCILIDEVHHASDDQKLRKVVNKWMEQCNFNSVLGFSGTPNMDPAAKIKITDDCSVKCTQYANVVTFYPLIKGIGNFLKIPVVRHSNLDSAEMAIRSIMSKNASIYGHLDYHIGHYVKFLLDEIFGEDNFRNEIIWHNNMQGNVNRFASNHDTIYLYSKAPVFVFNPIKGTRDKATTQIKRIWDKTFQKLINAKDAEGKIIYIESTEKSIDDVWRLSMLQPADKVEPVGYATQKPEALLERVIKASSNEGMVVANFFGGSGVTAAVANKLNRKFIHTDININSIQTARDRLKSNGASFAVKKVQDGVTLYRNPVQTKDAFTRIIPGLGVDPTIGSMWIGSIMDTTYGSSPVYVPDLMDSTSSVLDIVTLNRIINDAMPQLPPTTKRVIIYYVGIIDRQELEDFIKDNNDTVIEIELRDLKELLDNAVLQDNVEYTISEDQTKMVDVFTVDITRFYSDRVSHKINEFNQKAMANSKKKFVPIELSLECLEAIEMVSLDCTRAEEKAPWHSDSEIKIEKDSTITINGRKPPISGVVQSMLTPNLSV